MHNLPRRILTVLLFVFFAVAQTARGIYLGSGIEPAPAYVMLDFLGVIWILGWWLGQDLRAQKVARPLDLGMFLMIAWPLVVPYYLIKTRGVRALALIAIFVAVYMTPVILGAIVLTWRTMR